MEKNRRTIVSIAYRYNKGPSGGPGGSNSLLEIYNNKYLMIDNMYFVYKPRILRFGLISKVNSILIKILRLDLLEWFEKNTYNKEVLKYKQMNTIYIAHDVYSGYLCHQKNLKFLLVYHQQGSLLAEKRSFGVYVPTKIINKYNRLEEVSFRNSLVNVFTSLGSKESYIETSLLSHETKTYIKNNSRIIYNSCFLSGEVKTPRITIDSLENEFIFLSVTSLSYFKGVDQIPEFLSNLRNDFNFKWILIGQGPLEDIVKSNAKKYGIYENLIHINDRLTQEELAYYYDKADFYIMMHRLSIFDLSTLEAMSSGCVPVLSRVGGNIEFNFNDNVVYTLKILKKTLNEPNYLAILKQRNIIAFRQNFSGERLLKNFRNLLSSV